MYCGKIIFNKPTKCRCKTLNGTVCKIKSKTLYNIDNILSCNLHMQYNCYNYIVTIQKIYKGYRQRKLINIVYKRLPDDIQYKILYFIKRDTYQIRYVSLLRKLIEKRLLKVKNDSLYYHKLNLHTYSRFENNSLYALQNENILLETARLYNKYQILNIDVYLMDYLMTFANQLGEFYIPIVLYNPNNLNVNNNIIIENYNYYMTKLMKIHQQLTKYIEPHLIPYLADLYS